MDPLVLIILIAAGFFGSFYGIVAGGGTLLFYPALIFAGLPPSFAVATDKFSSIASTSMGMYKYNKSGKVFYKVGLSLAASTLIGAVVGTNILLRLDEIFIQKIIAVFLISVAILLIFKKDIKAGQVISQISQKRKFLGYILSFVIGIYAGFFGAGWGTLLTYLLILIFGLGFIESAATGTIVALAIGIATTIIFIISGRVEFLYGAILMVARTAGAYLGATFALKHGEKFAKFLIIAIALISGIKMLV